MEHSGVGTSNSGMPGCFECTARAFASHLQGEQDWYTLSDVGVSDEVLVVCQSLKNSLNRTGRTRLALRFVDTVVGLQGPWPQEHCYAPTDTGGGSISPPFLTPAMLSDYGTPPLSRSLGLEDTLVSPLSSLGLDCDSLADFASSVASYPPKEERAMSPDEKTGGPSTMRRIRRREQNKESYVS